MTERAQTEPLSWLTESHGPTAFAVRRWPRQAIVRARASGKELRRRRPIPPGARQHAERTKLSLRWHNLPRRFHPRANGRPLPGQTAGKFVPWAPPAASHLGRKQGEDGNQRHPVVPRPRISLQSGPHRPRGRSAPALSPSLPNLPAFPPARDPEIAQAHQPRHQYGARNPL